MKDAKFCSWRGTTPASPDGNLAIAFNLDGDPSDVARFQLPVADAKSLALSILGFLSPNHLSRQECLDALDLHQSLIDMFKRIAGDKVTLWIDDNLPSCKYILLDIEMNVIASGCVEFDRILTLVSQMGLEGDQVFISAGTPRCEQVYQLVREHGFTLFKGRHQDKLIEKGRTPIVFINHALPPFNELD